MPAVARHRWLATLLLGLMAAPAEVAGADFRLTAADIRWADELVVKGETSCDTGQLPLARLREAYFGRERLWQCTDAVLGLPSDDPQTPENEARAEGNEAAFEAYRNSCLVSFASVTDPNGGYGGNRGTSKQLIRMSSEVEVDRLRRSVGTLSMTGDPHYCSATLVDFGDGSTTLVTALHCLAAMAPRGTDRAVVTSVSNRITFRNLAGDQIILRLNDEITGREILYPLEDVVGLRLPVEPVEIVPASSVSPELFEPLLIVGASPYLSGKLTGKAPPADLADIIAVSLEPYCASYGQSAEGRLFYNCQTDRSQSGSAIITIRDARFTFNGVHTRSEAEYPCGEAVGTYNSGLAIGTPAER